MAVGACAVGAVLASRGWWRGEGDGLTSGAVLEGVLADAAKGAGAALAAAAAAAVVAWWLVRTVQLVRPRPA